MHTRTIPIVDIADFVPDTDFAVAEPVAVVRVSPADPTLFLRVSVGLSHKH